MSFCPFFKRGYFAVCTASGSNHVPSIAEMEQYCFRETSLCPAFEDYTAKSCFSARPDMKPAGVSLSADSSEK
ncbi:MAG TPA: hypothetical protein DD713_01485 [Nitrospiraceae bacterium]|nr:hypothetical protein [Nitrospiraceae bacterium]